MWRSRKLWRAKTKSAKRTSRRRSWAQGRVFCFSRHRRRRRGRRRRRRRCRKDAIRLVLDASRVEARMYGRILLQVNQGASRRMLAVETASRSCVANCEPRAYDRTTCRYVDSCGRKSELIKKLPAFVAENNAVYSRHLYRLCVFQKVLLGDAQMYAASTIPTRNNIFTFLRQKRRIKKMSHSKKHVCRVFCIEDGALFRFRDDHPWQKMYSDAHALNGAS